MSKNVEVVIVGKSKEWWKSKTIWSGVVIAVVGLCQSFNVQLPYELVYSICAGFGLYGVRDAIGGLKK